MIIKITTVIIIMMMMMNPTELTSPKRKGTKGSNVRKSYAAEFETKAIQEMHPRITQDEPADRYGVSLYLISK